MTPEPRAYPANVILACLVIGVLIVGTVTVVWYVAGALS